MDIEIMIFTTKESGFRDENLCRCSKNIGLSQYKRVVDMRKWKFLELISHMSQHNMDAIYHLEDQILSSTKKTMCLTIQHD